MHRIRVPLLVAVAWAGLLSSGHCQQGIRWEPSIQSAQQAAAQSNRLVLVYFWNNSCKFCRQMEAQVYTQPAVIAELGANYVCVKIDSDRFPAVSAQYGITGFPTVVITTPRAEIVEFIKGYLDAPQLASRLNLVAANMKRRSPAVYAQIPGGNPAASGASQPNTAQPNPSHGVATQGVAVSGSVPAGYAPPVGQMANPTLPATQTATPASTANQPLSAGSPSTGQGEGRYAEYFRANQPSPPAGTATDGNLPSATAMQPSPATATGSAAGSTGAPAVPAYAQRASLPMGSPPATATAAANPGAAAMNPSGNNSLAQAPNSLGQNPAGAPAAAANATPGQTAQPTGAASSQPSPPNTRVQPAAPQTVAASAVALKGNENAAKPFGGNPPLGLDGYCPVTLWEKQEWALGNRQWGAVHLGRTYLFRGEEEQRRFFADPDRYAPVASGYDVVLAVEQGQLVPGARNWGCYYGDRVYLFSSVDSMKKFEANPAWYAERAAEILRMNTRPGRSTP